MTVLSLTLYLFVFDVLVTYTDFAVNYTFSPFYLWQLLDSMLKQSHTKISSSRSGILAVKRVLGK